ncbi:MAG: hypothetical protein PHI32_05680 [Dysgonamonadaceae bacterium]|nr:hypothetical protein [Dysgonamonadaceae bacterium]MDD4728480.1 hypothetical protein [Dysgonamonadaceae bacterium]
MSEITFKTRLNFKSEIKRIPLTAPTQKARLRVQKTFLINESSFAPNGALGWEQYPAYLKRQGEAYK